MKVLFAVSNEEISESIVKKYQKQYKEIISYKNVYYFNAILKELQKDKNYDRIVISEELEAFTNTQYTQIDKFIFEKLDSISDEASNSRGDNIPIIVICSDRREKAEEMLVKFFGIGIYDALIGNDRSIDNVCNLLNKPRTKKEAKAYYKIDSDDVAYQAEGENDVSEVEIQNILAHYKRIGKDEKKYVESFDNIASQYTDVQLRIISKFLPLNVRAVLEEQSTKYQQVISFNRKISDNLREQTTKKEVRKGTSEKLLETRDKTFTKPVVIPSSVNLNSNIKLAKKKVKFEPTEIEPEDKTLTEVRKIGPAFSNDIESMEIQEIENQNEDAKRRRGRPRKNPVIEQNSIETPKRGRGRPRKNPIIEQQEQIQDDDVLPGFEEIKNDEDILPGFKDFQEDEDILPGFENTKENEDVLPGFEDIQEDKDVLPGFEDIEEDKDILPGFEDVEEDEDVLLGLEDTNEDILPGFEEIKEDDEKLQVNQKVESNQMVSNFQETNDNKVEKINVTYNDVDISNLLTVDKKVACFVGTSKNGTSFIVNNLAEITSQKGIDTAILDTTKNRNSYYIYTKNEEELRNIAMNSVNNLIQGVAKGIQVNNNLTVYTSLPDETEGIENAGEILQTLLKKHSLVLIDCDFNTPINYFEKAQEIYLVQTYDILTIQPLTAFLRDLKAKNILQDKKLRIVLNKALKVRGVNDKKIIGGIAYYNDPAMSFMTELFNKETIRYINIPFNEDVYTKYLEGIINCEISIKGYPKNIVQIFYELSQMVYPLISGKGAYQPPRVRNNGFTPSMNSTLDQMKKRY